MESLPRLREKPRRGSSGPSGSPASSAPRGPAPSGIVYPLRRSNEKCLIHKKQRSKVKSEILGRSRIERERERERIRPNK